MTPQKLLAQCQQSGVTVCLNGEKLKLKGESESVNAAAEILRPHKAAIIRHLSETTLRQLEQFDFEAVESDPEDREAVTRVNNMAWEFMEADGMAFADAIKLAAEIVVNGHVAQCEAAYTDVLALWRRLKATADTG